VSNHNRTLSATPWCYCCNSHVSTAAQLGSRWSLLLPTGSESNAALCVVRCLCRAYERGYKAHNQRRPCSRSVMPPCYLLIRSSSRYKPCLEGMPAAVKSQSQPSGHALMPSRARPSYGNNSDLVHCCSFSPHRHACTHVPVPNYSTDAREHIACPR
jgi:hypothetical protein